MLYSNIDRQFLVSGVGEIVLFNSVALGKSTTLQWDTTHPRIFGQYKMILRGFKKNRTQS